MNKKILGAVVTASFCINLMIASDIQESAAGLPKKQIETEKKASDGEGAPVIAGVMLTLSKHSFTIEAAERAEIQKKQSIYVATAEDAAATEAEAARAEVTTEAARAEVVAATQKEVTEAVAKAEYRENRWGITLTAEEIDLLAKIVWLEARGESEEGQKAVVEVVLNRMASEAFPDTLYEVLSQTNPIQFSSWKSKDKAMPTEKEYRSIDEVLNGNTSILRNDTLYFSRAALTPNLDVKIGNHSFCY
ncbi:MAG: cell wall hydrolase [Clostridiales bacterium]|nr:cell wall hydrolase [Clostridiales bacterium]